MLFELCFCEIAFKTVERVCIQLKEFWKDTHGNILTSLRFNMRTIIVRNRRYVVVHHLLLIQTFTMIVVFSSLSKKYFLVLILYINFKAKKRRNFHGKKKLNFSIIPVMIITAGKTYGYNIQFV